MQNNLRTLHCATGRCAATIGYVAPSIAHEQEKLRILYHLLCHKKVKSILNKEKKKNKKKRPTQLGQKCQSQPLGSELLRLLNKNTWELKKSVSQSKKKNLAKGKVKVRRDTITKQSSSYRFQKVHAPKVRTQNPTPRAKFQGPLPPT